MRHWSGNKFCLQVDTFEVVKNNIFDMLGDLAQEFNSEQLDSLFSKFETISARPVTDAMKIMDVMRRFAASDTKVGDRLERIYIAVGSSKHPLLSCKSEHGLDNWVDGGTLQEDSNALQRSPTDYAYPYLTLAQVLGS